MPPASKDGVPISNLILSPISNRDSLQMSTFMEILCATIHILQCHNVLALQVLKVHDGSSYPRLIHRHPLRLNHHNYLHLHLNHRHPHHRLPMRKLIGQVSAGSNQRALAKVSTSLCEYLY